MSECVLRWRSIEGEQIQPANDEVYKPFINELDKMQVNLGKLFKN